MPTRLSSNEEDVRRAEADIRRRMGRRKLDFPALLVVANIYRAATTVRNRIEREVLAEVGLTWGGFTILFVLWVWGPMEAASLADECGLAQGTLTGMVRTLARRGLVESRRLDTDRRRVRIGLTSSGEQMIEDVLPRCNAVESSMVDGLSSQEVTQLSRLLRTVIRDAG
ncbi:MAG: MarR family transcriptional regulator [Actinomycetes bacterium]|nr:MarR family transcriptional regulator [Acidimicrobiia bacterium]